MSASSSCAEALLARVLAELPAGPEAREARERIARDLRATAAEPPVDELEAVLRERFTAERARALLFEPAAHRLARLYSLLVADPPPGAPREHPQVRSRLRSLRMARAAKTR